jgi:predicted permease
VSGPILLRPIDAADGQPITLPERERLSAVNLVSPGFFDTFGTPILIGRDFSNRDAASAPAVVIVNQTFVRKLLRGVNPIGRTLSIGIVGPNAGSAEVIGVATDAVYASLRDPVPPTLYFPLTQMRNLFLPSPTLSVRSQQGLPQLLMPGIAAAVGEVNPDLAIAFRPLADQVDASIVQERVIALLSGFFGALAVLLAALGLFGVTLHSVVRRQREIGIRIALGAAPSRVMRLVLARVGLLVGLGVVVGVAVSAWASPLIASLLYGLGPRDPATFVAAAGVLAMVGLLAGWLPARRALRVDPARILRSE